MRFSIITPSFRHSEWLKLCIASVADQEVELEHIIQDSCSDDGTLEWLPHDRRVKGFIEKDEGMYDAVNRGLRRAAGDILAYLNCDEQYLPGALRTIQECFRQDPKKEVLFAHSVIVDSEGKYICDRRASLPRKAHTQVSGNLSILTAATFYRRSVIDQRGLFFNPSHRVVSDAEWTLSLIQHKVPMGVVNRFTSVFTDTGENMSLRPEAKRERRELLDRAPVWMRQCRPLIVAHYRLRRLLAGHYGRRPAQSYSLYTKENPETRVAIQVPTPTFRWSR